ncbi:AAA family ATPase [Brachybacterium tyrofermentans]|uniref:AAA family ATPase n=1 Tax=Brachybacterium tyrofermentans TaxID=47848 RepID=UPI003FD11794
MKYVVKGLLLGLLIGAAAGGILLGSFGALLTFTKNDGGQALAAVLFGFAVAGFYGAIPGGVLGGIGGVVVGLIRRAMANSAAERQAQAVSPQLFSSAPMASAAPAVPQGHWIGAVGESLETRAEVQGVELVRDVFAEKDLRWLHRLVTPQGHALQWLANNDRGLTAGDRIVLRGTVKDHTWASDGSVTEVWFCQARKDANPWPEPASASGDGATTAAGDGAATATGSGASGATGFAGPDQQGSSTSESLDEVLAELDSLPGLESVAGQVRALANRVRLDKERERRGMAVTEREMHAVFIGPPGTGKTTVARIWGRVLAATGLLPSGHVIETDRSGLVGQHVGEAAQKTTEVIDRAKGGVLFVDEAYSLTPGGPASNDFGSEAVDVLLKRMEDERDSFCVIVAGYPREMERFLESNTGLRSRFAQTMTFPNYDATALATIFTAMAAKADYALAPDGQQRLFAALAQLADAPPTGWANARSLRALLSAMVDAQTERLAHETDLGSVDLGLLTAEDVSAALEKKFPGAWSRRT